MARLVALAAVAALAAGCGGVTSTPAAVSAPALTRPPLPSSPTEPSTAAPPSATGLPDPSAPALPGPAAFLKACDDDPTTLCGQLDVPVDRANPGGDKITLVLRLLPRTDMTQPALATVLALPGGPGSGAGAGPGYQPGSGVIGEALVLRHDTLLIDPRGTGSSGAIDCPDLQDGFASDVEMQTAVAACAAQLGDNADRYGSGDVALDIEDVRAYLGLAQLDIVATSYGTVWARAYASRFPDHVHALVLDSGFAIDDAAHHWGEGYPRAWIQIAARYCAESPTCAAAHRDPEAELTSLVRRVRAKPVRGPAAVLDATSLIGILGAVGPFPDNVEAERLLDAAAANARGDDGPLLELADWAGQWPGDNGDPTRYSEGMHAAATCIDDPAVPDPRVPIAERKATVAAAVAALPKDAFAPFTVAEWAPSLWPDYCLGWPVPDRYEPAIQPGSTVATPTLVLVGEQDGIEPAHIQHRLLDVFPNATWAVVAGAVHAVMGWSICPRDLMAEFLDTLHVDGATCAP